MERRHLVVQGVVQGVGFRPFIYCLAHELGISGWVVNSPQGVIVEAEAPPARLDIFAARLQNELPPNAVITHLECRAVPAIGEPNFEIRHSQTNGSTTALILPDLAICPACLLDITNGNNRRYRYPFTNCTHCGPRFTIINGLPYDRENTTMRAFAMCDACRAEYENPLDRRFHAQPTACPTCGPQLALWDNAGRVLAQRDDALKKTAEAIQRGKIVAVKGLGGFHLMVDSRSTAAVARLRQRKHRPDKPLAVMFPSLKQIQAECEISALETTLLTSPQAPIILLRRTGSGTAVNVAPDNPYLGVMLPYTPLHYLLLHDLDFAVVATSGNLAGEPICTDEDEALERLGAIADLFLVHDRPIARHVDDSIVRVVRGREMILRRARGYAPLPIMLPQPAASLIAAGAHLKNTAAVTRGDQVFISQHLGDMDSPQAYTAYQHVIEDLTTLCDLHPTAVVCDLHPDYRSTRYADETGLPVTRVQHHYAHVLSCMAEHGLHAPVLGVAWDGTGYGLDGTIWGGEFLLVNDHDFERFAYLSPFRLPGGEQAIKEPRRSAIGLLYAVCDNDLPAELGSLPPFQTFTATELGLLKDMLRKGVNAPLTSSMGRLFDAVAALIGLCQRTTFEGQAAMALEFAQNGVKTDKCYPFGITEVTGKPAGAARILDLKALVMAIIQDVRMSYSAGEIAAAFHNTLAEMIVRLARDSGETCVVLSGGCFQNMSLLERAIDRLSQEGFSPYWHQRIPPNDGGIVLGQVAAALRSKKICV